MTRPRPVGLSGWGLRGTSGGPSGPVSVPTTVSAVRRMAGHRGLEADDLGRCPVLRGLRYRALSAEGEAAERSFTGRTCMGMIAIRRPITRSFACAALDPGGVLL